MYSLSDNAKVHFFVQISATTPPKTYLTMNEGSAIIVTTPLYCMGMALMVPSLRTVTLLGLPL